MNIVISHLPHQGVFTNAMAALPPEIGIEVYAEIGCDYHWDLMLPKVLQGRTGLFTVHGPFLNLDLSSPELDYPMIRAFYEWTFRLCQKYHADHCVCHPYGYYPRGKMSAEEIVLREKLSVERVIDLNRLAGEYGVKMLVENMYYKDGLLDQEGFERLFLPVEELNFLIDIGHVNVQNWDVDTMFAHMSSRIKAYHINDNDGSDDSHIMAFEGIFDWEKFFRYYKQYTPEATMVCEYMNATIEEIMASVDRIKAAAARA